MPQLIQNSNLNINMNVKSQNISRSSSLTHSSGCSFITPRKAPSNCLKGLKMTITKIKDEEILKTRDKTQTPDSSHKNIHFNTPISKQNQFNKKLFPDPSKYSPLQVRFTPRNKSLPAFNFHHNSSGFSTLCKPYNKLTSPTVFKPKSSNTAINFASFTPTLNLNDNKHQKLKTQFSPFPARQLNIQSYSNPKLFRTVNNVYEPVCLNSDSRVKECKVSEIYLAQTPKKQNSMRECFALKNLRKRLTKNTSDEGPSTISSKGKFQSDNKKDSKDFQFSLNLQGPNSNLSKVSQKNCKILHTKEQKGKARTRSTKEKEQFFNLTPKQSQELDLEIFELTQSNRKQINEKESESPFWKTIKEVKADEISFIKPVKRKLDMNCEQAIQNEELNESLIIEEVLSSLDKNKEMRRGQMRNLRLELIRRCSSSLCLTRNQETNSLFGLMRLGSEQKFVEQEEKGQKGQMCVRKYLEWGEYVIVQPFEYTLEEIFDMKLVDKKSIQELIRKFHLTLNEIKQKEKGKINLSKLKERIVYTHGDFKLIPTVQKP